MKLLLACALLATASASTVRKVYDNHAIIYRLPKQYMSAYIPSGQCSGWISHKTFGCQHEVAYLNVSASSFEAVKLDLHQGKEVTILREFCIGEVNVKAEYQCSGLGSSGNALPEVPRARRHALLPRSHQNQPGAAGHAPLPPAPNSY